MSKGTRIIGIIGGMGPMATYDLAMKIVNNTKADKDQDHIRVITDCNTNIPDRTRAILSEGDPDPGSREPSPLPEMTKSGKLLEKAGADFLIMPCNTAHYFIEGLRETVNVPIISMPEVVAKKLTAEGVTKALVLATDGTVQSGVYEKALAAEGIQSIYPDEAGQKLIMSLIYDYVKAGNMDFGSELDGLRTLIDEAAAKGAEKILLACTELPMAFEKILTNENYNKQVGAEDFATMLIDPTLELAKAAIREAGGQPKNI